MPMRSSSRDDRLRADCDIPSLPQPRKAVFPCHRKKGEEIARVVPIH